MHLHLRTLAVVAALVLGAMVSGWGLAASLRPTLWSRRAVRWCVGWTPEPVSWTFGVAVATFGAGIVVSGIACALIPPGTAMSSPARLIDLTGLGIVVLGGVALVVTNPAPIAESWHHDLPDPPVHSIRETPVPSPVASSNDADAAHADLSPHRGAAPRGKP